MGSLAASDGDPFYDAFKDHRPMWSIIPPTGCILLLAVVGQFLNFSIVWTTYRNPNLRSSCNYLLAIACAGDIFHQMAHYPFAWIVFSTRNFISIRTCLHIMVVPLIGLNVGLLMTLIIGADRLFSVLAPFVHRKLNLPIYVSLLLGICVLMALKIIAVAFEVMSANPNGQVMCVIADSLPGPAGDFWFKGCVVVNFLTITCYLAVWVALRVKTNVQEATRRIFKSLTVIMTLIIFGWVLNAVARMVLMAIDADIFTFQAVGVWGGVPVNITVASNAIILYVFSQDYRRALRVEFNLLAKRLPGKPQLSTTVDADASSRHKEHSQTASRATITN